MRAQSMGVLFIIGILIGVVFMIGRTLVRDWIYAPLFVNNQEKCTKYYMLRASDAAHLCHCMTYVFENTDVKKNYIAQKSVVQWCAKETNQTCLKLDYSLKRVGTCGTQMEELTFNAT